MSETIEQTDQLEEAAKENASTETLSEIDFLEDQEERKIKRIDSETLSLDGDKYKIIEDYREALDLELLEERYSDFLEKYDFIVGDISYEKLRLRGFYEDKNKKVPIDMRISSLEDYLLEYCSFGCKYFVLNRLEPKKKYRNKSKRQRQSRQSKSDEISKKQKNLQKFEQVKKHKEQNKKHKGQNKKQNQETKKSFVKKERNQEPSSKKEKLPENKQDDKVRTVKDQKGKTKFQIRRKK